MNTLDKINNLLVRTKTSGSRMCKDIGLSSGLYSQWVNGRSAPSRRTIKAIADYFNVPYETLLPDDEEKEKAPSQNETGLTGLDQELVRTILSLSEAEKASLYAFLSTHKREE